eukprot:6470497-Amphidinium_carterae.1
MKPPAGGLAPKAATLSPKQSPSLPRVHPTTSAGHKFCLPKRVDPQVLAFSHGSAPAPNQSPRIVTSSTLNERPGNLRRQCRKLYKPFQRQPTGRKLETLKS